MKLETVIQSFNKLENYCKDNSYMGYDPYDGLNSKLFQAFPVIRSNKYFRLAWIQFFKRSPINFRRIAGVEKGYNPKALGLFLSAYCVLYKKYQSPGDLEKIHFFSAEIIKCQSKGYSGACWGYNFDWQAKAFFQPRYTPTVVASSFIAQSLLDAYAITGERHLLDTARSTCDFIMKDLNRTNFSDGSFAFSYSPQDNSVVYNATLLGAHLLARVYEITQESLLKETAEKTVTYVCKQQNEDGSWAYGTYSFHQWVDNFHTGYNLECLYGYSKATNDHQFDATIQKGFEYYISHFFMEDGRSKYYNNRVFPIDVHAPSQLMFTLKTLAKTSQHKDLLGNVLNWTIQHMQDRRGYFYYQVKKRFTSKIPYMRWSQAWMFFALAVYLDQFDNKLDLIKTRNL